MNIKKFKKRPIIVEAIQYIGKRSANSIAKWMSGDKDALANEETIRTLEEDLHVSKGDWIIKGIAGDFYSCKPDIFKQTYEREF